MSMIIPLDTEARATKREKWLEARRETIGSSDVAAILGLSKYRSPFDVWAAKVEGIQPEVNEAAVTRGNRLELSVLVFLGEALGAESVTLPEPYETQRGPNGWASATADGWAAFNDPRVELGWPAVLGCECKTDASLDGWGDSGTDKIRVDYALQCHWCMYVYQADRWAVGAYFPHHEQWRHYIINRNPKIEAHLLEKVGEWRERHIVEGRVPEIDASASVGPWLRQRYPEATGLPRPATPAEAVCMESLFAARGLERMWSEQAALLRNQLAASLGNAEGCWSDAFRATYRTTEGGRRPLIVKQREDHS